MFEAEIFLLLLLKASQKFPRRQGSPAEALMLAKKYEKHDWYIKLQIEDHEKYSDVIDYISNLAFKDAEHYMKKYGNVLIQHVPYESTQFLKVLCTNYKPANEKEESFVVHRADPEDYIHLFLSNSERLVEFLEFLIGEGCVLTTPVYDTLLEHYLYVWESLDVDREKLAAKTLKLLQNPEIKYDKAQALVVCHMHSFSEGILYLYEEQKLYQQILRYHMSKGDSEAVLTCCKRFGHQEPSLYVQALWSCIRDTKNPPEELLSEILTVIATENLLSPQLVIEAIGSAQSEITLGHIRPYITAQLEHEHRTISDTSALTRNYESDSAQLKTQLDALKSGTVVVQVSRCAACHHPLELPSLHFLCQHSYHQYCFQSFADSENECPACLPQNKDLLELLKAFEYNKDLHETFHSQLEKSSDGFSVAADYFRRGVFNTYFKVITTTPAEKKFTAVHQMDDGLKKVAKTVEKKTMKEKTKSLNWGAGAEARLRQGENARGGTVVVAVPEGRLRVQERGGGGGYGGSLEANITKGKNPFESDEYDEAKNPFNEGEDGNDGGDDDYDDKNPFKDDYDCDKNLNPFN